MCFYHILHKNSIRHLLRTSRDSFRPPPPKENSFRKEMDTIILYLYVHFRGVSVVFVVSWPKKYLFYRYSCNFGERAVQRTVFAPPPFTPRSDR